ncbi:MAG: hypothetical protein ACRDX8_10340 [Acidimicrobiales bacterium]
MGIILVIVSLVTLANIVPLLSYGGGGFGGLFEAFEVFALVLLAITLVLGVGCVYLARRVQQGDRVARVLAIVVCITIGSACILTSARDLGWVLSAVVALATAGILAFDPVVKAHFLGEDATYGAEPSAVVAARVLLVCVACAVILVGIMFLPLGAYEPSLIAVGLIYIGIGGCYLYLSRRLAAGSATARVVLSGIVIGYVVLAVVAGHAQPGVLLPVSMALCILGLLWLPESSRNYFATLQRPTQPAIAGVEGAIDTMVGSVKASLATQTWSDPAKAAHAKAAQGTQAQSSGCPSCGVTLHGADTFCGSCGWRRG